MNDTVDASSKYQDSLPVSSDAILEKLDNWGDYQAMEGFSKAELSTFVILSALGLCNRS
jgi:hypothetical protein